MLGIRSLIVSGHRYFQLVELVKASQFGYKHWFMTLKRYKESLICAY